MANSLTPKAIPDFREHLLADDPLEALDLSIGHWQRLASGTSYSSEAPYSFDCALCHMFVDGEGSCANCPIMRKTGVPDCEDTPWAAAARAYEQEGKGSRRFRDAAATMHQFLLDIRKEQFNV